MKVFITGGSGFIGSHLTRELTGQGYEVTLLTRSIKPGQSLPAGAVFLEGNPTRPGPWQDQAATHNLFINLAGASIFHRWTDDYKQSMRESRLQTTRNLVEALSRDKREGKVLISASAVGYYGFHQDEELDESSPPGQDFLAILTRDWEEEAQKARQFGVRVIRTRFGIVLGEKGGALEQLVPLFNKGLGTRLGSGTQWFSWIHQQDLSNALLFLINQKDLSGVVNCTSPHPVLNRELSKILAAVLKKPAFLPPVPGFMLKLIMGEFGNVLLKGQRVLPHRLLSLGFSFQFPQMKDALIQLLDRNKR
ncbi:MAG: TIGR01777 family oxidoreductase [Thermodesulfobacteriota bacterium]